MPLQIDIENTKETVATLRRRQFPIEITKLLYGGPERLFAFLCKADLENFYGVPVTSSVCTTSFGHNTYQPSRCLLDCEVPVPPCSSPRTRSFSQSASIMGKLTSTIGIPIKLLNEAQVSARSGRWMGRVQANETSIGPRRNTRVDVWTGVRRQATRR